MVMVGGEGASLCTPGGIRCLLMFDDVIGVRVFSLLSILSSSNIEIKKMDVEQLIEEVREFPVLYDQKHDKYRNTEYKDRIWRKIATTLEARGGRDECKKRWASIRDQLRKTLQRRKTDLRHRKYKFEDLLQFLVPHLAELETISNLSHTKESEEEVDKLESIEVTQEEDFNAEQESMQQSNRKEKVQVESRGNPIECLGNSFQPALTSSAGSSATSMKNEKFVRSGSLKRKREHNEAKSQESMSSQLMAFILAEAEKKVKRPVVETTDPVDAFLAGIAPSLKSLNPILLNQAKGSIFTIVQEFEMKQLLGYQDPYMEHEIPPKLPPFSAAPSSSGSVSTPHPSPLGNKSPCVLQTVLNIKDEHPDLANHLS